MTKDKESPYFTKRHPIYGITLYSIDGNTWSTNPSELTVIQDRLEKGLIGSIDKRMIPPRKRPAGGSAVSESAPKPVLAEDEDEEALEGEDGAFDEEDEEGESATRAAPTSSRTKRIGDALRSLGDELGRNDDDDDDAEDDTGVSKAVKSKAAFAEGNKVTKLSPKVAAPIAAVPAAAKESQAKVVREKVTPLSSAKKVTAASSKTIIAPTKSVTAGKKAPIAAVGSRTKPVSSKQVAAVKPAPKKSTLKSTKSAPAKSAPSTGTIKGAKTPVIRAKSVAARTLKGSSGATKIKKSEKTAPQKKGATPISSAKKASAPSRGSKRK